MSLWSDGLEAVPRTGSATRPEAADGFVTSAANEVLDFGNRPPQCTVVHLLKRADGTYTLFVDGMAQKEKDVELLRFFGPHVDPDTNASIIGPVRIAALAEEGAIPPESVSVRLKSECRQDAVSSDPAVDVLQVADLPVGSPDVPRLETVVVPFPVVHTPPPHVFLRDVKYLKEAEAKKIGKLVGFALQYFLGIFGMVGLSAVEGKLNMPDIRAIYRGPALVVQTVLAKLGFGKTPYELEEEQKAVERDSNSWGVIGTAASATYSGALGVVNFVARQLKSETAGNTADAGAEEETRSMLESLATLWRMTTLSKLISEIPAADVKFLASIPDPSADVDQVEDARLKAVTGITDKISQAFTTPVHATPTPRRFKFTIPQISKSLKTMSKFSETIPDNNAKSDTLIPLRAQSMLRESLLAEWIMQRETVVFNSQYQKLQEDRQKKEPGTSQPASEPATAEVMAALFADAATSGFRYPSMSPPDFTGFNPEVLNKNTASLVIEIVVSDSNKSILPEVWSIRADRSVGIAAGHVRREHEHAELKSTVQKFEEDMRDPDKPVHKNSFFRLYFMVERFFRRVGNTSDRWVTLSPIGQLFTGMMGVTRNRLSSQIPKIERYFCDYNSTPADFVRNSTNVDAPKFVDKDKIFHVRGHRLFTKFKLSGSVPQSNGSFFDSEDSVEGSSRGVDPIHDAINELNSTLREFRHSVDAILVGIDVKSETRSMIVQAHERKAKAAFEVALLPAPRPRLQPGAIPPLEIVEAAFVASTRIRNASDAEKIDAIVGHENGNPRGRAEHRLRRDIEALSGFADVWTDHLVSRWSIPAAMAVAIGCHRQTIHDLRGARLLFECCTDYGLLSRHDLIFRFPHGRAVWSLLNALGHWDRPRGTSVRFRRIVKDPVGPHKDDVEILRAYARLSFPPEAEARGAEQLRAFQSRIAALPIEKAARIPVGPLQNTLCTLPVSAIHRSAQLAYSPAEKAMALYGIDCERRCDLACQALNLDPDVPSALALRSYAFLEAMTNARDARTTSAEDAWSALVSEHSEPETPAFGAPSDSKGLVDRNAALRIDIDDDFVVNSGSALELAERLAMLSVRDDADSAGRFYVPYGYGSDPPMPLPFGFMSATAIETVPVYVTGLSAAASALLENAATPPTVELVDKGPGDLDPMYIHVESKPGSAVRVGVRLATCYEAVDAADSNGPEPWTPERLMRRVLPASVATDGESEDERKLRHGASVIAWNAERILQALLLIAPGRPGAAVRLPPSPRSAVDVSLFEMDYRRTVTEAQAKIDGQRRAMRSMLETVTTVGSELWPQLKLLLHDFSWMQRDASWYQYRNEVDYTAPASSAFDFEIPGEVEYGREEIETGGYGEKAIYGLLQSVIDVYKGYMKLGEKPEDVEMFKRIEVLLNALKDDWPDPDEIRKKLDDDALEKKRKKFTPADGRSFAKYYEDEIEKILGPYEKYVETVSKNENVLEQIKDYKVQLNSYGATVPLFREWVHNRIDFMQKILNNYDASKDELEAYIRAKDDSTIQLKSKASTPKANKVNGYARKAYVRAAALALTMAQTVLPAEEMPKLTFEEPLSSEEQNELATISDMNVQQAITYSEACTILAADAGR